MSNPFQNRQPNVGSNRYIRTPQREAYKALLDYASNPEEIKWEVTLSPEKVVRLAKSMEAPPAFWMRLQMIFDFAQVEGSCRYDYC